VDLGQGFERAKEVCATAIQSDVRSDIGGDEQRIHDIDTHYSGITFKHLLLPVYTGAYRFNQKVFQIVVNGRSGEIQGDRPYSFWKIALFVAALILVLVVVVMIVSTAES
jgi:hypothetical protein